jgi:phosphoribosylaminoimidazole-succinocarboxamide synthase
MVIHNALQQTDFDFPGQTSVYHGKVRDAYVVNNKIVLIASDRISAFDVVLPRGIPYKGQVLNQIAAHQLNATKDIVPNWVESIPDPNVTIGKNCTVFPIEMIVRGYLCGSAWREYTTGVRDLCGNMLPNDMRENQKFAEPIITPTTKEELGHHDQNIEPTEIVSRGVMTKEQWDVVADFALQLFKKGQELASKQGLILCDTKYEFGITVDGQIVVIDEIHTPDSSRYFYADSYDELFNTGKKQKQLSKEFVREWLMDNGFSGKDGERIPEMTDEMVSSISDRYIELFEKMTGETFKRESYDDIENRIETNVRKVLSHES